MHNPCLVQLHLLPGSFSTVKATRYLLFHLPVQQTHYAQNHSINVNAAILCIFFCDPTRTFYYWTLSVYGVDDERHANRRPFHFRSVYWDGTSSVTVNAVYRVPLFRRTGIIYASIDGTWHFPGPKWRLKLLPVPVSTAFLAPRTRFPIRKSTSSRLPARHRPLTPWVRLL